MTGTTHCEANSSLGTNAMPSLFHGSSRESFKSFESALHAFTSPPPPGAPLRAVRGAVAKHLRRRTIGACRPGGRTGPKWSTRRGRGCSRPDQRPALVHWPAGERWRRRGESTHGPWGPGGRPTPALSDIIRSRGRVEPASYTSSRDWRRQANSSVRLGSRQFLPAV